MYYEKFFPFHAAYADSGLFEGEDAMEQEFELMKSWFPATALQIQEQAQEQCRLLDYEGSPLYDEYPDKLMLRRMRDGIRRSVDKTLFMKEKTDGTVAAQGAPAGFLDDLVEVILYQEISHRRCLRRRCRGNGPGNPGGFPDPGGPGRGPGSFWNPGRPGKGSGAPGGPGPRW